MGKCRSITMLPQSGDDHCIGIQYQLRDSLGVCSSHSFILSTSHKDTMLLNCVLKLSSLRAQPNTHNGGHYVHRAAQRRRREARASVHRMCNAGRQCLGQIVYLHTRLMSCVDWLTGKGSCAHTRSTNYRCFNYNQPTGLELSRCQIW